MNKVLKPLPIIGMLLMLLNNLALAMLDICSKTLRQDWSASVIVFTYKTVLLVCILPWVLYKGFGPLKTKRFWHHILRSLCGTLGATFFICGLKYIDMSDAAALENVQYILVIAMGVIFFGERLTIMKSLALLVGFVGVIIIIYPDPIVSLLNITGHEGREFSFGAYKYTIIGISFWAVDTLIIKSLGNTESSKTQIFYKMLFASLLSFPAAVLVIDPALESAFSDPVTGSMGVSSVMSGIMNISFVEMIKGISWSFDNFIFTGHQMQIIAAMAVLFFVHSLAYINAVKVDLSTVIPLRYSKLLFSVVFGYLFFGELEFFHSYFGYALIIVSGILLFKEEQLKARKINS